MEITSLAEHIIFTWCKDQVCQLTKILSFIKDKVTSPIVKYSPASKKTEISIRMK